jgi:hypothetical protein
MQENSPSLYELKIQVGRACDALTAHTGR